MHDGSNIFNYVWDVPSLDPQLSSNDTEWSILFYNRSEWIIIELLHIPKKLATGFEPVAYGSANHCSTWLSHTSLFNRSRAWTEDLRLIRSTLSPTELSDPKKQAEEGLCFWWQDLNLRPTRLRSPPLYQVELHQKLSVFSHLLTTRSAGSRYIDAFEGMSLCGFGHTQTRRLSSPME